MGCGLLLPSSEVVAAGAVGTWPPSAEMVVEVGVSGAFTTGVVGVAGAAGC